MEITIPGIKRVLINGKDLQFPDPIPVEPSSMEMEYYHQRGSKLYFRGQNTKLIFYKTQIPEDIILTKGKKYLIEFIE